MTTARRIDAHHHVWDPAEFDYPWMTGPALDPIRRPYTMQDLEPELRANAITGTVLVQTISSEVESRRFLELASADDSVLGVVGWVNLTSPAVGDALDELIADHGRTLVGIRHQVHDEPDPEWLARSSVRRGLQAVHERGLSYDLLVRTRELPAAIAAATELPEVRFVLDHIGKPRIAEGWDEEWSAALADLARRPNVSVKLSGMVTEADWNHWRVTDLAPYVERVVELFGADRAMFGSDWPVCLLAARGYTDVVEALGEILAPFSERERERIFGGTAIEFYGLADGGSTTAR